MKNRKEIDEFLRGELRQISDKLKEAMNNDVQNAAEIHYLIGLNMGIIHLINKNGYAKGKKNTKN